MRLTSGRISPRTVAAAQAGYFLSTALPPLLSRRGFERVTGPKADWWLVVTVSWLVGAIGTALGFACRRSDAIPAEIRLLGAASAAALAGVDVFYAARRRISPVYLLDAVAQLALVAGWLLARELTPRPASC